MCTTVMDYPLGKIKLSDIVPFGFKKAMSNCQNQFMSTTYPVKSVRSEKRYIKYLLHKEYKFMTECLHYKMGLLNLKDTNKSG